MKNLIETTKRFMQDEEGATAVEYGIMVALIAAVIIAAVRILGTSTQGSFETVNDALAPVAAPVP